MRVLNRPLAFILAAALIAGCVILIAEVIGFAVHKSPLLVHWTTWYQWAAKTRWDAGVIRVWSAVLIVIGLLILAVQLKPPRVTRLPLRSGDDDTDAAVTRRGLARTLRAAAPESTGSPARPSKSAAAAPASPRHRPPAPGPPLRP